MPEFEVEAERPRRSRSKPASAHLLVFRPRLFAVAGIAITAWLFGTPHLLVSYTCMGQCSIARAYSCDYIGIRGWRSGVDTVEDRCPVIRLLH